MSNLFKHTLIFCIMAILPLIIFFAVFRMTKDKEPFVPLQYTISYFEDKEFSHKTIDYLVMLFDEDYLTSDFNDFTTTSFGGGGGGGRSRGESTNSLDEKSILIVLKEGLFAFIRLCIAPVYTLYYLLYDIVQNVHIVVYWFDYISNYG